MLVFKVLINMATKIDYLQEDTTFLSYYQTQNCEGVLGHRDSTPRIPAVCPRWNWRCKTDVHCQPHMLAYNQCSLIYRNVIIP
jgi:hypothetical protein